MFLGLNFVDYVIIASLLFFAVEAFGRPLLVEVLDLTSFAIAFFLSFILYNLPSKVFADQFYIPHGLSLVLGFITIWFGSEIAFYTVIRLIIPRMPFFSIKGEKFLSVIPALLRGIIFVALFLVLLATFPIQPKVKQAVLDSKIGSTILRNSYQLEQPVKNVFGGVGNDTLTFLTIKPKTNERVDLGFKTSEIDIDEKNEADMIDLVNKERNTRGLKSLVFDEKLRSVARKHSADMFQRGYFSHYSPENESVADRVNKLNVEYVVIGENLAYAPSLELAHRGLMNSPGHKANILSPEYGKIGIGILDGGVYGKMFTQVFSN